VEVETGPSAARAAFEPVLQASASRLDARTPPATLQEGMPGAVLTSNRTGFSLSLVERLPTATTLQLVGTSGLAETNLGNAVTPRIFRAELGLSLTQPLLRDFSLDLRVPRAGVLRAEFATETALQETRLRAMLTVKATEDGYWNLVESYKAYEVNVGARELAERQLELTRRQIVAGVLPDSDVIGVEGTLAQRQLAVVRAEAQIGRAADLLRTLMNLAPPEWERPLVPVDAPAFLPVSVPFDDALGRAVAARPELRRAHVDLKRVALELDVARNGRLPRLDLLGGVSAVGQDQAAAPALDQLSRAGERQWSVGLNFAWAPIAGAARGGGRGLQAALR
jgi:outer membrane protein TolC